jgi:hypothetical protein
MLNKLNYKGDNRIAIINAGEKFLEEVSEKYREVIIDTEIDQRCPYGFMIIFVTTIREVSNISPMVLHNLTADGTLWFCYPKKYAKKFSPEPEHYKGWKSLNDMGFHGTRMVSLDENWSALRFRNIKYIRSGPGKSP